MNEVQLGILPYLGRTKKQIFNSNYYYSVSMNFWAEVIQSQLVLYGNENIIFRT